MSIRPKAAQVLLGRNGSRLRQILMGGRGTIFMLHRIHGTWGSGDGAADGAGKLRRILSMLRRSGFEFVSLMEMLDRLETRSRELPRSVCFTVDDGYADFFSSASPVFQEFGCPATVFLTTGFLDGEIWMWWDKLDHVFRSADQATVRLESSGQVRTFFWRDVPTRERAFSRVCEFLKSMPHTRLEETIRDIASELGVAIPDEPPVGYGPMTWDHVRMLAEKGFSFGPHTVSHPILSRTTCRRSEKEISESWYRLNEETDAVDPVFAYPNGTRKDYTKREKQYVKSLGLRAALSTNEDYATARAFSNQLSRFSIPRFGMPFDPFRAAMIVSGIHTLNPSGIARGSIA